jgi:hypothetical protein
MATSKEIADIKARLDETEQEIKAIKENQVSQTISLEANTIATQKIADNTAGMIELYADLAAGTKFLCRLAMAVQWVLEMIEKYYKKVLILCAIFWAISHNLQVPEWAKFLFK